MKWFRLGRFTRFSWMEESYYYSSAGFLCRDRRMDDDVLVIPQMHSMREYGPWENRFYDESSPVDMFSPASGLGFHTKKKTRELPFCVQIRFWIRIVITT